MYNYLIKNSYIKKIFKNYLIKNENDFINSSIKNFFFKNIEETNMNLPCYLDVFQFAGGNETHQIIKFFYEFYQKWFKKNLLNIDIIYCEFSNYGIKKFLISINEIYSYFLFKNENGIHRIIRKNPLSSNDKIQTSYLNIVVIPYIQDKKIIIKKEDLIIDYYKSKGPGGQHVNNTNSAVRITHIPTNIIVTCQSERSQFKNKNFAFKILKYKLHLKNNFNNNVQNFNKKYVKTYYFENNLIVNHLTKKKYNLNNYFKLEIDFIYDN